MMIEYKSKKYHCPLEMTIDIIGGKWKVLLLWHLNDGVLRNSELQKIFPEITPKMLFQQLKSMEEKGLVIRTVYAEVPPRVEYSLTDFGKSLLPILYKMNEWGQGLIDSACGKTAEE